MFIITQRHTKSRVYNHKGETKMKNKLKLLIDLTLASDDGSGSIRLTGDQLLELVRSRRVKKFVLGKEYARYNGADSTSGYQGYAVLDSTRKQALEIANEFKKSETDKEGNQLYYRVYVSAWNSHIEGNKDLYINL